MTPQKTCTGCDRTLPIDHFRRRRKGSEKREARCRQCHAAYMREYRQGLRELRLERFAANANWQTNVWELARLSRAVVRQFGGLDAFAREFAAYIQSADDTRHRAKYKAKMLLTLTRLLFVVQRSAR